MKVFLKTILINLLTTYNNFSLDGRLRDEAIAFSTFKIILVIIFSDSLLKQKLN